MITVNEANEILTARLNARPIYVALADKNGKELEGGGYARRRAQFAAPVDGQTANSADLVFPQAESDWGTVSTVQFYGQEAGGELLFQSSAKIAQTVSAGNVYTIPENHLVFRITGVG